MCPDGSRGACDGGMLVLESRLLTLVAEPGHGGKLCSLVSRRTGCELFYRDRRTVFDASRGYSHHDIGGFDECFPTVAACRGRTDDGDDYDHPDHGLLWQRPWEARVTGGALEMSCALPSLGCEFHRRCSFASDAELLLEYRILNTGSRRVPFVYSAHPLLAADERTRVSLPAGMRRTFVWRAADTFGAADEAWFDLPGARPADITGPFRLERRTFVKMFSDRLSEGRASVAHPATGDRLILTFDTRALPHLGFLASQGHDSLGDGHFAGEFLLALEPTTGVGDDIPTGRGRGVPQVLLPGEERRFWIRLAVESM